MEGVRPVSPWRSERVPTGVPNLDRLTDGGFSQGDLVLIVGGPGTGKTILAAQMAFHWAALGRGVLWLVTLAEPNEKFLAHLSEMRFFDPRQVGVTFHLVNVSRFLPEGLEAQLRVIRDTVRSGEYDFVVIDGFQGFRGFLAGPSEVRVFLSDLSSELALGGTTLVVTTDADPGQHWENPEFTAADCLIQLDRVVIGGRQRRQIQVSKMRGRGVVGGWHSFSVDNSGVSIHPRIESVLPPSEPVSAAERQALGVPGLDHLLDGGVPRGTLTLVAGAPGTGKGFLADHFLAEGLRQGQACLYVCVAKTPGDLLSRADRFGLPLREGEASGRLHLRTYEPARFDPDECAAHVLDAVESYGIERLAVDDVGPLVEDIAASGRTLEYLTALAGHLRGHGVTTMITSQQPELFSAGLNLRTLPLAEVADNVIVLRFADVDGRLRRKLAVVKTRYSYHRPLTAEVLIEEGTLDVVPNQRPEVARPESAPYYAEQVMQHEGESLRPEQRLRP
jgi:circadian clock protein KaiC